MKRLALLLLLSGCAGGVLTPHGRIVPIVVHGSIAGGSVVGRDLVLTVDHVAPGAALVCDGRPAEVLRRFDVGGFEALVLLRVEGADYPPAEFFAVRRGTPRRVLTPRGAIGVDAIIPGDSGYPAVSNFGELVACVSARRCAVCGKDRSRRVLPGQRGVLTRVPRGFRVP